MTKTLSNYGFNTNHQTYIIAEIGINHGGDLNTAKRLIDSAARTGVDAVKFQTYLTEQRAPKGMPEIADILKKCELPFAAFEALKQHAAQYELDFFSTPFDSESLSYLETIHCPLYKVASFDVTNHALLQTVAATGKPVIMSVGMANLEEITAAYSILKQSTNNIAILHCISAYPTEEGDANLGNIATLQSHFDCVIGQSDHTTGIAVPLYAIAAGAQVIEKHYKIDDNMDCIDAPVSITEQAMTELVIETRRLEKIMGSSSIQTQTPEQGTTIFRRTSTVDE